MIHKDGVERRVKMTHKDGIDYTIDPNFDEEDERYSLPFDEEDVDEEDGDPQAPDQEYQEYEDLADFICYNLGSYYGNWDQWLGRSLPSSSEFLGSRYDRT